MFVFGANQTRGALGRVCATGMYRSIEHVEFPNFCWMESAPRFGGQTNLVPRARFTFGQHQERDLSVLNVRTSGYTVQNQRGE